MEWVKTTAKTLPEAIDLALDNLGVDESEAEIVVLEEPRQGLFGRMRGTARVEARVKPKAIRPKTERNRNRKGRGEGNRGKGGGDRGKNRSRSRSGGGQSGGGQSGNRSGGKGEKAEARQSGSQNDGQQNNDGNRSDRGSDGNRSAESKGGGRGGGNKGGGNRSRGGRGNGEQQGRSRPKARNSNNEHDAKPKEETPVEEVADHLQKFLSGLTEAFGLDSPVTIDSSEQDILVGRIEGQHGLLVGPKGRTLDAVQELARISCQRTVPSSIRIKVDVGGYRQQRVEALTAFARKAADSAAADGVEVALEPMSPADRKAIHDALSEDGRVETRSVGSEPRRKVLVVPLETAAEEEEPEEELNGQGHEEEASADVADTGDETSEGDVAEEDEEMAPAGSADSEE